MFASNQISDDKLKKTQPNSARPEIKLKWVNASLKPQCTLAITKCKLKNEGCLEIIRENYDGRE